MPKIKMVPVYFRGESRRAPARDFVREDGAQEMVDSGVAEWAPNGRTLLLKKIRGTIKLRDLSCQMPVSVMERYADGCQRAIAMVEAWRWQYAA